MNLTNLADIRALLARHDFRFSKSRGQNFLTAAWVPADIADASGADEHTGVLEVGPASVGLSASLAKAMMFDLSSCTFSMRAASSAVFFSSSART